MMKKNYSLSSSSRIISPVLLFISLLLAVLLSSSSAGSVFLFSQPQQQQQQQQLPTVLFRDTNLFAEQPNSSSSTTTSTTTTTATTCPFSRVYPRYQINLSRPAIRREAQTSFLFWPFNSLSATVSKGAKLETKSNSKGVAVLACLWQRAADLITILEENQPNNNNDVYLTFPHATPQVVRQWVDLFQWSKDYFSDSPFGGTISSLNVTYDEYGKSKIPSVLMTVTTDGVAPTKELIMMTTPFDHDTITQRTQSWVKRILVQQGICPFTKSKKTSGQGLADVGVPVGRIAYHTSRACNICDLQADIWHAIHEMLEAGPSAPKGVSSILLAAPLWDTVFDIWAGPVFALLEAGVLAANVEQQIGVVCFHPAYQVSDGSTWPGFGHMHSVPRLQKWISEQDPALAADTTKVAAGGAWQRRTPHATVNVLRAEQLAAAEERRNSAELYYQNIRKLVLDIGLEQLELDLERERAM